MRRLAILGIRAYRATLASRAVGCCRFRPSCSAYALASFERYGTWIGMRLTVSRLWRCRPPWPQGDDPVPATRTDVAAALRGQLVHEGGCGAPACAGPPHPQLETDPP